MDPTSTPDPVARPGPVRPVRAPRRCAADRCSTDRYATDRYAADRFAADRYAADRHAADRAFDRFQRTQDPHELETVVRETARPLLHAAQNCCRDASTAEDLVQTTYLAAIRGAATYDPRHPLVPWLLGILSNRARRHRRTESRTPDRRRIRRETIWPDPRDTLDQREVFDRVGAAIGELPARYRRILELHLFSGFAPREIALELGRSGSTIRTQLSRGLAKLREELRPYLAEFAPHRTSDSSH